MYYESVIDDVTGKWRLSVMSEEFSCHSFRRLQPENFPLVLAGAAFFVPVPGGRFPAIGTEYSYVDGEEHDAKLLYSGTPLKSYIVYVDNGDIEKSEE